MEYWTQDFLVKLTTPFFAALILVEIAASVYHKTRQYSQKETLYNFYLMAVNTLLELSIRGGYLAILLWVYQSRVWDWSRDWVYWAILIPATDFVFYWIHRVDHFCRLFWAVHVTHHSSEEFNLSTGYRSSVLEPLYRFVYFIPLAWLGFQPLDILFAYSFTQLYGILAHTQNIGKLGVLEYVFVTPSHHRVHHASNPLYLDKNLGMFLIIWDRLFGTFQEEISPEEYEQIRYGLTKPIDNPNPIRIITHEFESILQDLRQPIPWRYKMGYLFGPPGWSHDQSRMTSEQMRQAERCAAQKQPTETEEANQPENMRTPSAC